MRPYGCRKFNVNASLTAVCGPHTADAGHGRLGYTVQMANQADDRASDTQLRAQINQIEQEIAVAELELAQLNGELAEFEAEFDRRVGPALQQLTELEAEVSHYLQRIKQMRAEKRFGEGYQPVEDQFDAKWNRSRQPSPSVPPPAPPPLTAVRLKKVYRELARRYHPDLAIDEADRAARTAVMTAVIEAYQAQDLAALLAIAHPTEANKATAVVPPPAVVAALGLEQQLKQAQDRLRHLQTRLQNFHHQPLVELSLESRLAARDGRDLLAEMVQNIVQKVARKQAERDLLQAQFAHLQ